MQVLYQLSYGPIGALSKQSAGRFALALGLAVCLESLQPRGLGPAAGF